MSPEQAKGDAAGPASDIFNLGLIVYAILTGKPAFDAASFRAGDPLQAVRAAAVVPPRSREPRLSRALEAICLKALATRPEDRYASARHLARDVESWMGDEPVTAWREPLPTRLARWGRRHKTLVAAFGLSLATAVAGLSIVVIAVGREQARTRQAQRQAEENFHQARQAVDDYFTFVSEETLLDQPGLQPLRKKLLESARDYHQSFLRSRGRSETTGRAGGEQPSSRQHQPPTRRR